MDSIALFGVWEKATTTSQDNAISRTVTFPIADMEFAGTAYTFRESDCSLPSGLVKPRRAPDSPGFGPTQTEALANQRHRAYGVVPCKRLRVFLAIRAFR